MSMNWGAAADDRRRGWGCGGGRSRWRPVEIAVMVLGFIVYWPVGAAMLAFKIWQKKTGYPGDPASFCREAWASAKSGDWSASPFSRSGRPFRGWGGGAGRAWRARATGNTAFDQWRDGELGRLEEERRKLEAAEREFADYINNLRSAKDREEFDRFMRERRGPSSAADQPGPTG